MKILHIISSVNPSSGGPIEGILRQHEVTKNRVSREIVCCDSPSSRWLSNFPIQVYALGIDSIPTVNPPVMFLNHYRYSPKLIPWLQENLCHYDAVIVNGLWNYASFAANRSLANCKVPYFVFTHGQLDPWFKKAYPVKDLFKQLSWSLIEGPLLSRAKAVIFTCQKERTLAQSRYLGHQRFRGCVIGYGTTQPPAFSSHQSEAFYKSVRTLKSSQRFLLFLSRIHKKKGCDLLVDAFADIALSHPRLDLVIAGPDQEGLTDKLKHRASLHGISSRVHWPGALTGEAKWGAFHLADAFILPSHSENFGIVLAEAMACGTPVLTTNKVNICQEIRESGGGIIEADTREGTRNLINQWIALSLDKRMQMKAAAKSGFTKHFQMDTAADNLLTLIREELNSIHSSNYEPIP